MFLLFLAFLANKSRSLEAYTRQKLLSYVESLIATEFTPDHNFIWNSDQLKYWYLGHIERLINNDAAIFFKPTNYFSKFDNHNLRLYELLKCLFYRHDEDDLITPDMEEHFAHEIFVKIDEICI